MATLPPPPLARTYWVTPSLLAGVYPGSAEAADAAMKVRALCDAGVTLFVDLTTSHDHLEPYEHLLSASARRASLPVPDLTPPTSAIVAAAIEIIDRETSAGGVTYVHCWGGIGRTGSIVGCWLAERMGGPAALDRLTELRSSYVDARRRSPETAAQCDLVRRWRQRGDAPTPGSTTLTRTERIRGCLLGGAVGDALGAPVEFTSWTQIRAAHGQDGVTDLVAPGRFTDDTQMSLFTAEGMLRASVRGRSKGTCHPPTVVHHAYLRWLHTQGDAWDERIGQLDGWLVTECRLHRREAPGNTCLSALRRGTAGTTDDPVNDSKGCGGVMRAAPVGLVCEKEEEAWDLGCSVAALTHGHVDGWQPAGALAVIISRVCAGAALAEAVAASIVRTTGDTRRLLERAVALAAGGLPTPEQIESTLGQGWVGEEALAIAVACTLATTDFRTGVTAAVSHSGDSDSTGSICGNILGATWGAEAIPATWLDALDAADLVESVAADLAREFLDPPELDGEWWDRYPGW
jgi:ADP-ribosylglycohydrolase